MSRPLIGITARLDLAINNTYLRRYYAEAVEAAGGIPVLIPLIPQREYLFALGTRLDGLLLSGSDSDVDPIHYDEEPHQNLGTVISERDQTDQILLQFAEANNLPVLGICFGCQSLNVSRGGTLWQDIPAQIPNALKHRQGEPYRPIHSLNIEPDSLLAQIAGATRARVNTSHHQAIKAAGENLRVTAHAPDGVIECIEDTRPERFALGVQWHPEMNWQGDHLSEALFLRLVQEASKT